MTSFEAFGEQGYDRSYFDSFSNQSNESLRFSTGGGQKDLALSIGFRDQSGLFGSANRFLLDSCPMVRSIGLDVEQNGLGFIWMPGCKPYYVRNPAECQINCGEENKFYAARISQNVPFFQTNFYVIPGVPAAVDDPNEDFIVETPPDILEEPVARDSSFEIAVEPADLGDRSSIAAEVREVAPDGPLPLLSEGVIRAREELFQSNIGSITFQSIPCVMFAIEPNSFPREFEVIVLLFRNPICLNPPNLVSRSQSITWLFRSLPEVRSFWS